MFTPWGVVLCLYAGSVMLFISQWKHLLSMLLCIEFMSLCSCMVYSVAFGGGQWISFLPVISVFIAIEAALGMALMVLVVRSGGSERMDLFNLLLKP